MGLSDLDGEVALDDIECSLGSRMVLTHRAKVGVVIGISSASVQILICSGKRKRAIMDGGRAYDRWRSSLTEFERHWCALEMEEIPIGSGPYRVPSSNGRRFRGKIGSRIRAVFGIPTPDGDGDGDSWKIQTGDRGSRYGERRRAWYYYT
ncbi:Hypothetical predicted protein [Prunus dulcis]|uniref:Uncharacterized protein n=1 Tax=Prunus dulcis TaxID=3755 RepID=A0A5E4G445_PRUDU|nr:Hypothetical predicted protein [Prunus dulcis]